MQVWRSILLVVIAAPFIQERGLRYGWVKPRSVSAIQYSSKKILLFSDFSNSQNYPRKLQFVRVTSLTARLSAPLLEPVQRLDLLELDFSDDGLSGAQRLNVWNDWNGLIPIWN